MIDGAISNDEYWYDWRTGYFHNPDPKMNGVVYIAKGQLMLAIPFIEECPGVGGWIVNDEEELLYTPMPAWLDII